MKKINLCALLLALFSLVGCGGEASSSKPDLPENITLSVQLSENFEVTPGSEFELEAVGSVSPYNKNVELTYKWTKITFFKPMVEIVADYGGSYERALRSLESEVDFSTERKIKEVAPALYPGGYVQYNVRIGAKGYSFDLFSFSGNSLYPGSSAYSDNVLVYVVE
jgi:ABC-type phosphate transport system substrate-binding protein